MQGPSAVRKPPRKSGLSRENDSSNVVGKFAGAINLRRCVLAGTKERIYITNHIKDALKMCSYCLLINSGAAEWTENGSRVDALIKNPTMLK